MRGGVAEVAIDGSDFEAHEINVAMNVRRMDE
jgi:hypothetical protein